MNSQNRCERKRSTGALHPIASRIYLERVHTFIYANYLTYKLSNKEIRIFLDSFFLVTIAIFFIINFLTTNKI